MDAGELRELFDDADGTLDFSDGSIEAVKARAAQRDTRRRTTQGVAGVCLAALIGLVGFQLLSSDADQAPAPDTESSAEWQSSGLVAEDDFTYVGSFLVPDDAGDPGFAFGGHTVAYNPAGDGSLFLTGRALNEQVAEISIPTARPHGGTATDLFVAEVLQPFADITSGRGDELVGGVDVGGQNDFRIGGLEVVDGRLHWTAWMWQNLGGHDVPGHGHSSLDLSNPDTQGPWYLGDYESTETAGYLFDVPQTFANEYLDGRQLISGFQHETASEKSSWGPPFFAYDPPEAADPSSRIDVVELVNFDPPSRSLDGFEPPHLLPGADWIATTDGRQAVVGVGNTAIVEMGECTVDNAGNVDAFGPRVVLYDPNDLALGSAGVLAPWEVEPYAEFSLAGELLPVCGARVTGMAYDEANSRLFIVQAEGENFQNEFSFRPVIHIFRID